jgi:hypothetical protein
MATRLPYTATTATGERFDITFPLHPQTASPMRVSQLVTAVLEAVDRDVMLDPTTSNGDVLQAMAMALAIRASMIEVAKPITDRLATELVKTALSAMNDADRRHIQVGHA